MTSLLITGASGFIGRHLLARLNPQLYDPVYCLSRSEEAARKLGGQKHLHWMVGSLFDSDMYGGCLESIDVVIHLAATTGKAPREEYFRVNADGTRHLLAQCQRRGVKNFLYVSSIAATYQNKTQYYYAQSKQAAEDTVRHSALQYAIVRPTIVLGKESPGWQALSKLARLPLLVVFGDGCARIQPVDVNDVADALLAILEERRFHNESFDVGGPEIVSMEEFLRRVRRLYYDRETRTIHLPWKPMASLLAFTDRYAPGLMPLNAGQLCALIQDGTAVPNWLWETRRPRMKDLDTLLRMLTREGADGE